MTANLTSVLKFKKRTEYFSILPVCCLFVCFKAFGSDLLAHLLKSLFIFFQETPKVLCWLMGTWLLIFQAFWKWRRWIPWFRNCCPVQSVCVKLCPCTGWNCAPADERWKLSYSGGQIHGNGSKFELTAPEGIKSLFQHCLPGSVGLKVLLRSNGGSCKPFNSFQRIRKANEPCTFATGAWKRVQGSTSRDAHSMSSFIWKLSAYKVCIYERIHIFIKMG